MSVVYSGQRADSTPVGQPACCSRLYKSSVVTMHSRSVHLCWQPMHCRLDRLWKSMSDEEADRVGGAGQQAQAQALLLPP